MGGVPAALLALLIACARPAAFALTVEPFETAVEPVDSAEKNRAEELSTAEPIDLGGNTDDLGPQTFAPPTDDDFDYTDDEEEPGDGGETGNGDAYGNAGETGNGDAFDNAGDTGNGDVFGDPGETGNGDRFGIAGENGNSDVGDGGYGQEPGNGGETGYGDDPGTVGDGDHGEEPGDQGETENLDEGTGAQWGGEVDDAAYEGSNDLKKAASDEVSAGSGNDGMKTNGTNKTSGHPVSELSATNHTGKLSANVNTTSTSSRNKKLAPSRSPKNETREARGRIKFSQAGSKVVRNKSESSLNGTLNENTKKHEDKVKNGTNSAGDENTSSSSRRMRGKSRVSRGGVGKESDEPRYWNGYKTYVNVNRTRVSANATDTGNKLNETGNGAEPDLREHGGNGGENSEVKARVVEIPREFNRSTTERNNLGKSKTPPRELTIGAENSNNRYSSQKNETKPEMTRPTSGGLLQAESNKRSYNYDETQVPPPAGEVQEIITYDYGDITEIIIPDNSPAPIPSPSPASEALTYGLHPDSNPHAHNSQPYYEHSTNGYPKYTPEHYPKTTVTPHNALPTYSHFHPPPTSPYPTRSNFDNYGSNVGRNPNYHSPPNRPTDSNFDYAPSYNQNSSRDYNSYPSMPRTNPVPQSLVDPSNAQSPVSGHEFKSPVNSEYNTKPKNYAPQYGGSSSPNYDDPGFHSKHSGPNSGTTPYYNQHSSGPVYEYYGTPKSKTWVSYESIPIKNPSTDAGPPVVEIIYHRENGVVYEDDVFDDLTTSSPESGPLTSTSGYFPPPSDFPTSGDYPTYGNGRPPPRKYGHANGPTNKFSNDTRNKKKPTNGNFRPAPLTSDAPRREVPGRTRPQKKRPNPSPPSRKPDSTRPDNFDVEDFPDDFPEEPKVRDPIPQSKKKPKPPPKNPPSRKLVKPPQNDGHKNPKHHGFSEDHDFDFHPKLKTKTNKDGKDIVDSAKISGFGSDDEGFPKHSEIPDFAGFPKITETPDFSPGNDDFPSGPKIPDFDSDDDDEEFSEKDQKEFEEAEKLITGAPQKTKQGGFEHNHEHKKTKSAPLKHSDPSTNLRQRKEKSEKSNKGEKYDSGHKKSEGKKGEKSVKSDEKSSEGERLHKSEAAETEGAAKKGAKKKESKDEGGYYAEKAKGEEGEKAAKFHDDEKHAKGHSTKGKHEVHKKDEFSRKHSFFDEHHEGGKHEKEGGYEAAEEIEKGGEFHAGHKSGGYKEGHNGKKGRFKEGKRFEEDKGEEDAEGHDEKSEHDEESGKKEGKEEKEKKAFEL